MAVLSMLTYESVRAWFVNEKLRADLAAIRRLAQVTGHDLKHDIGSVLNYVEVLEMGSGSSLTAEICFGIREAMNKALGKLQNLLMAASPGRQRIRFCY